jgi:hypothetical protein
VYAQVPDAMDYLLAEFHKVCMYTVPKHLHALNVSLHVTDLFSIVAFSYLIWGSEKSEIVLCFGVAISWTMCPKDTPSDPYYSSLVRMYLPLKCV